MAQRGIGQLRQDIPLVWLPLKKKRRATKGPQPTSSPSFGGVDTGLTPQVSVVDETVGGGATPADEVANWFYDPKRRRQILEFMVKNGFEVRDMQDAANLWEKAVSEATKVYMTSGGRQKVSPWDILEVWSPTQALGGGPPRGQSFTTTTRYTNIDEMGPEEARQVLTVALREALGREPTGDEIEDFASRANAIVAANPQVTETTTRFEWNPETGQYEQKAVASRQIGPSAAEVRAMVENEAMDTAQAEPDYAEFQAAGTIMNWLMNALASPV